MWNARRVFVGLCLLIGLGTLFGCSARKAPSTPAIANKFCQRSPLLQKYNCSLSQVQQAAELGEPDAQYALGYMYYYGVGTAQDKQTGVLWIRKAAAQGQPLAVQAVDMINHQKYPAMGDATFGQSSSSVPTKAIKKNTPAKVAPQGSPSSRLNSVKQSGLSQSSAQTSASSSDQLFNAAQQKILARNDNHYTIQLMGNYHLPAVLNFMRRHHLQGQATYYQTRYHGRPWYVLIYGDYDSRLAARMARQKLPRAVQSMRPWVKSVALVQREIRLQQE